VNPSRPGRRWLYRGLLGLGGLVAGLVLAEGVSRLVQPEAGAELLFGAPELVPAELFVADPTMGLLPRPGSQAVLQTPESRVELRFDALGLRGSGLEEGARWLALGDSFVMALQVAEEQTFTSLLGQRRGVQVLNAGVDGHAPPQALLRFRQLAAQVQPSVVVLVVFVGNDLTEARRPSGPMLVPSPSAAPTGLQALLLHHSMLAAHLRVARARARLESGLDPRLRHHQDELQLFLRRRSHDRLQPAVNDLLPSILALQGEVVQQGARFVVAVAPPALAMDSDLAARTFEMLGMPTEDLDVDAPALAVEAALGRAGLTPCSLTGPLRESHQAGRPPYFRFDGHWNAAGHTVVADAIDRCVGDVR
jgi:SGNH hydrolase-like domain, acetyltransferase AlgX